MSSPLVFPPAAPLQAPGAVDGRAGAAAVAVCHVLIQDEYWHYLDVFLPLPHLFSGTAGGALCGEDRRLGRRDLLFWTLWLAAGLCYLAAALPRLEVPPPPHVPSVSVHHRPHVPGGLRLL